MLAAIIRDAKGTGLKVITVDEDSTPEDATEYLARHDYIWANYHDTDHKLEKAVKVEGIPLTVLIDAQGEIVYYDFGGDEAAVRKAIAGLGPQFASVAGTTKRP